MELNQSKGGATGGSWGWKLPNNVPRPPSAPKFVKFSVHCRHLYAMFFRLFEGCSPLKSFVALTAGALAVLSPQGFFSGATIRSQT